MIAPQPFFRPRGTPFSVLHRIRALLEMGHTVDLATYPFGETPVMEGLTVHRSPRPLFVRDVAIGPSIAKIFLDIALFRFALKLHRRESFDLVHTHEEAGVLGAWLAKKGKADHVYDMHSSLPQQFGNFGRFNWSPVVGVFRALERYTLNGARGVITICPELKEHVDEARYPGPVAMIENTLDVDCPVDVAETATALRKKFAPNGEPIVVYTGTLEEYQGLPLLLESAPQVVAAHPRVRFLLVGGRPDQIDTLRERTRELGVDGAFTFVPAVKPEEVFAYHRLADMLITTRSRGTNTPLKIYQYLRADCPIVATRIRSHTQVLNDHCAVLVEPNAEAVAAGVCAVLDDPALGRRVAQSAAALAEADYSAHAYRARLRDFMERVAAYDPRVAAA